MASIRSINGKGVLFLYYAATHKMVKFIQMVNDSKVHRNTNFCMLKSRRRKGEKIL
jgi:hypothetical protein